MAVGFLPGLEAVMNRRAALKTVALAAGALSVAPRVFAPPPTEIFSPTPPPPPPHPPAPPPPSPPPAPPREPAAHLPVYPAAAALRL